MPIRYGDRVHAYAAKAAKDKCLLSTTAPAGLPARTSLMAPQCPYSVEGNSLAFIAAERMFASSVDGQRCFASCPSKIAR